MSDQQKVYVLSYVDPSSCKCCSDEYTNAGVYSSVQAAKDAWVQLKEYMLFDNPVPVCIEEVVIDELPSAFNEDRYITFDG